jgi:hypothetical protein
MANTTNYNWETPDDTDLVKDGAAAIRTLGNSIDTTTKNLNPETTTGDIAYRSATANTNTRLAIGSSGQVLTVAGGVPSWATPTTGDIEGVTAGTGISGGGTSGTVTITNSMATAIDAKGDLVVGTGADTFARLAVGTNGHTLVADSAETTGLKWAAPAGGGKVLQVIYGDTTTATTVASTSYADTGLSASITPASASNKVLVLVSQYAWAYRESSSDVGASIKLLRSSTTVYDPGSAYMNYQNGASGTQVQGQMMTIMYLDSPSTTSATTYKTQGAAAESSNNGQVQFQRSSTRSSIILMEIGA